MRLKFGGKVKKPNAQMAMSSGANRPHARLDHELIVVAKQANKRNWRKLTVKKMIILFVAGLVLLVVGTFIYIRFFDSDPEPVVVPVSDDPFQGQQPDWAPVFEYKTKDQR